MDEIIHFAFNEKSSVLLIFFFNAMVFSYLLLKKGIEEQNSSSKWLAAFIFLGGLYICPFMFGYAGWYGKDTYFEILFFIPFQQLLLIGPVFYFYVKSLLQSDSKLTRSDLIHFAPAAAYFIYSLMVFVVDKLILDEFYFYADGKDMDLDLWYQIAGLISMLYYLYLSLRKYLDYRKLSLEEVSFADEIAFKWLKHFTIAFGLILVLRVLFFILNPEWGEFGRKYWYYLCFSILLMYISITGYSKTIRANLNLGANPNNGDDTKAIPENAVATYETDDDVELQKWSDKITHLFQTDRVYENQNLTLTDLARNLGTNRNIISKTINQEFNMNFNDFVNQKRAEAVIVKLKNGDHVTNTLLGIAIDCGFNSKTTFNRAFKKFTGITPKQFIAKNAL